MGSKTTPRKNLKALEHLGQTESVQVLEHLLKRHPELRQEAEAFALGLITSVEPEAVAEDLAWAFEGLDQEEIWERSGADRYGGYTDPGEAADEICEERMAPFMDELDRLQGMDLGEPALAQVKGMLLGLSRLKGKLPPDAEEYPSESGAHAVLEGWAKWAPPGDDPSLMQWIRQELPEWAAHLERLWGRIRERSRKAR